MRVETYDKGFNSSSDGEKFSHDLKHNLTRDQGMYVHVCVCDVLCVWPVCLCLCCGMYVCMYVCMGVHVVMYGVLCYVRLSVRTYVCLYVCVCVCGVCVV